MNKPLFLSNSTVIDIDNIRTIQLSGNTVYFNVAKSDSAIVMFLPEEVFDSELNPELAKEKFSLRDITEFKLLVHNNPNLIWLKNEPDSIDYSIVNLDMVRLITPNTHSETYDVNTITYYTLTYHFDKTSYTQMFSTIEERKELIDKLSRLNSNFKSEPYILYKN